MPTDIYFMKRALYLALKGRGKTSPNPMVGAVLVKGGRILSEGWHAYCGGDHAEVMALKKAGRQSRGASLYVTLEPCGHVGRTPPCVEKIIASEIKEVIVGVKDPNPRNNGKSLALLKRAGLRVRSGYLAEELNRLNESFNKYITQGIPFVVAKTAQTLDGKIATRAGQSQWVTSEKSRKLAHALRDDFDAILVGINTVIQDDPFLKGNFKKNIKKIILDSHLQIPLKANLFKGTQSGQVIVATTAKLSNSKIKLLEKRGAEVLISPAFDARIKLKWLFQELAKRGIANLLVEGGAAVIGSAFKENLVDKVHLYIAPKILGDEQALSSIRGLYSKNMNQCVFLKNLSLQKIGEDLFIEAYVYRHR